MTTETAPNQQETPAKEDAKDVYYFGYGPMVNDMVRQRRGIEATAIQAAYVADYRLTFAFGGLANIVPKIGFEVHGLLMKLKPEDWEKVCDTDNGHRVAVKTVIPYSSGNMDNEVSEDLHHNADNDFIAASTKGGIQAHLIELPKDLEDTVWDTPLENPPQERYLKLIAQGMRQYKVDEDYVTDEIEACPFLPTCKPENFGTWPCAKKVPTISFKKYVQICQRGKQVEGDLYFVIGKRVFRCGDHDPNNPGAQWIDSHCHGKPDFTYLLHTTVVDPDIPLAHSSEDILPLHWAWAENYCCEIMETFGMNATRVYELREGKEEGSSSDHSSFSSSSTTRMRRSWKQWIFSCCPWKKKSMDDTC